MNWLLLLPFGILVLLVLMQWWTIKELWKIIALKDQTIKLNNKTIKMLNSSEAQYD